ncbi:MAG: hypothetical protein HZA93_02360 [Verrucomicrobia bacterium]|nr:hypothetical protein [Verrucomicrobiota bacterium]
MKNAAGWIAGLVFLLGLSALALRYYVPPLPGDWTLQVEFPAAPEHANEPLFVTDSPGIGDFLFVRYVDAGHVAFGYDRWGRGGPVSAPQRAARSRPHTLRIESPSLANVRGSSRRGPERLRVTFNGTVVIDTEAEFRLRRSTLASVGLNQIGGSTCAAEFSGKLTRADGRPVHGRVRDFATTGDRLAGWFTAGCWQFVSILLLSAGVGWAVARVTQLGRAEIRLRLQRYRSGPHRWFITAAAPCGLAFAWLLTWGTGQFAYTEDFGNFYDYQAASLLQGRLNVPFPAVSGEAFIVAGKSYGYFGVTPALLRLPFVIFDLHWGQLIRGYMLAYYLACLVAAYGLLRHATRLARGPDARPSAVATVLFTLSVGLGSTLFFLGARAYIYHEAILCGAMFALWCAWFALRWLDRPGSWAWIGALLCGWSAVHARPSSGLFALTLVGFTALAVLWRTRTIRVPVAVGALAVAGVLSFNGLSYLKFGTFDGSPFQYSIQYDAARRARFGDRNFHLVNWRFNTDVYVLRANFELQKNFPWIVTHRQPRESRPEARIDLIEYTLGFPYAMPALFALALLGGAFAAWRVAALRLPVAVVWAGCGPMAGALFCAVVTSHRYTADFCPFFVAAGACGLAAIEAERAAVRRAHRALLALLVAASIFGTGAMTLWFQAEGVWGIPEEVRQNHRNLGRRIDAFFGVPPAPP